MILNERNPIYIKNIYIATCHLDDSVTNLGHMFNT